MRLLLSNHQLVTRSGSELATCELARGLKGRGHDVAVFTFFKGPLASELEQAHDIPVFDDMQADRILLFAADVVHTHHAPCAHFLRLYTPGAVRVHSMLGASTPLEAPPLDPSIYALGLAISEEVRDKVLATPFADAAPLEIFRNWFDDAAAGALPITPWSDVARVAVISNHVAPALATALTTLKSTGDAEADYFGVESISTQIDAQLLSRYDLIVSIGRTALLAAASGKPCIMADVHGSDGLLTAATLDAAQTVNFSGRLSRTPITAEHLRAEVSKARALDMTALRARVLQEFNLATRLDYLEQRYTALLAKRSPRLDRGDWPAEGQAYAELAARVRHAEHLLARERALQGSERAALAAEINTLAQILEQQSVRLDGLAQALETQEDALHAASHARDADAARIDHLQRTLASRDEAIAWLQTERAFALSGAKQTAQPRPPLRAIARSALATVAVRAPLIRTAVRALIPLPLRARLHRMLAGPGAEPSAAAPEADESNQAPPLAAEARPDHYDVICFANIDWAARFQRPQQLMQQFARAGHRVFYVVASRRPLDGAAYTLQTVAENICEVSLATPQLQDFYANAMSGETLSAYGAAIDTLIADQSIRSAVQIVHLPFWAPLNSLLRASHGWKVSYDCMDEWDSFPNIGAPLLEAEHALVDSCDLLTVTSSLLQDKWRLRNGRCLLLRNGVDNTFFAAGMAPNTLLDGIAKPIIGYYGALAEWVDFALIAELADAAPAWSFVLVGDHFTPEVALVEGKPNVHLLGLRPYTDMPRYLYNFDACIIPFKLNKVTHAVDPVKFYEFLAGGKPVVATPLEELQPFADYVSFASTADDFRGAIAHCLEHDDRGAQDRRKAFARSNDWADRFAAYDNALARLHPLVSIIIVTYGNLDLTRLCLESVLRCTHHPRREIIIVDNASSDATPDYLRDLSARHSDVRIILNDTNRGFAAANNQALAVARGDVLVLLNNDTVVPSGWLSGLLFHLEDAGIGLVGPVTNSVGNEAKITPGYSDIGGLQTFADARRRSLAGRAFDIPMLAMFCVAMRRDVFDKIGPLDENFGIGMFEDDDYSMRVRAVGLRIVCAEDVYIHHFGQAAFKKLIASGEYDEIWQRNQSYYESKWGAWRPHAQRTPA